MEATTSHGSSASSQAITTAGASNAGAARFLNLPTVGALLEGSPRGHWRKPPADFRSRWA